MSNPSELWLLHCLAEAYGQRPAAILRVEDEWAAYQVDVAALVLGRYVERETAEGKVTPGEVLRRLPGTRNARNDAKDTKREEREGFARLGGMPGVRRMKVPESGVW